MRADSGPVRFEAHGVTIGRGCLGADGRAWPLAQVLNAAVYPVPPSPGIPPRRAALEALLAAGVAVAAGEALAWATGAALLALALAVAAALAVGARFARQLEQPGAPGGFAVVIEPAGSAPVPLVIVEALGDALRVREAIARAAEQHQRDAARARDAGAPRRFGA